MLLLACACRGMMRELGEGKSISSVVGLQTGRKEGKGAEFPIQIPSHSTRPFSIPSPLFFPKRTFPLVFYASIFSFFSFLQL